MNALFLQTMIPIVIALGALGLLGMALPPVFKRRRERKEIAQMLRAIEDQQRRERLEYLATFQDRRERRLH